jgi:beta-lactamase class A
LTGRRLAVALALAAVAVALPAPALGESRDHERPYPWNKRVASANAYARLRSGRVAFAVVDPDGRVRGRNIHERHRSASVVKAMLMIAYLNERGVRERQLNRRDKALLRPMITRSDNRSATRVRNIVGNDGLLRLARRARMKDFATARSWGSTQISPYDQARLLWRFDAFIPRRHRGYARTLLANVIGPQRWGLPRVLPRGWRIYLKGGWLPPRVVNQVALLERGERRIAIAVMTDGDRSFRDGQNTIAGVGKRLLVRLNAFER